MSAAARRLLELYRGREGVYAELNGHWAPVEAELTEAALDQHVTGTRVLGVYVVRQGNIVSFGSGEFDNEVDPASTLPLARRLRAKLVELGVPEEATLLSFSGHKGHHLDVFVSTSISAGVMRRVIDIASVLAGLEEHEIFPKQDEVAPDGYGNLLKLPLCIHPKTRRLAEILDSHVVKPCDPVVLHHIAREHAGVQRRATADKKTEPPKQTYRPQQRHDRIAQLAGKLNSEGVSQEAAELACLDENRKYFEPPLQEDEVLKHTRRVYARYAPQHRQGPQLRGGDVRRDYIATAIDPGAVGVLASDLVMRPVDWLWPGWLPLGMLSVLDGDPELGKSQLVARVAAHVTTAKNWPDGSPCPHGNVIIVAGEDSLESVWKPRLVAAGADLTRIRFLNKAPGLERLLSIPEDVPFLEKLIRADKALLLVFDPIMPYLSKDVNANSDKDVRRALTPLAEMLDRTCCSGLLLRHLNKNDKVSNALYRGGGSIAFSAIARANITVARMKDDEGGFVMMATKQSLAKKPRARRYDIEEVDLGERIITSQIVFGEESDQLADDLVTAFGRQEKKLDTGERLLRQLLADGPLGSEAILAAFDGAGISRRTAFNIKKKLGIKAEKKGFDDGWVWLPPTAPKSATTVGGAEECKPSVGGAESEYEPPKSVRQISLHSSGLLHSPEDTKSANGDTQHPSVAGRVRIVAEDGDYQLVDVDGKPMNVGLFVGLKQAASYAQSQGWEVVNE